MIAQRLAQFEGETPGVKTNLYRLLNQGRLAGSGKLAILAVDQGFEHGPARSFAINPPAFDPHYHYQLAIDAGLSGYAAPLGWLEAGADTFAGQVPLILKLNSGNSLMSKENAPDQAITATPQDAIRLGCVAIGMTIYPGSDASLDMFEDIQEMIAEAKSLGLATILWSYPRGNMSKAGETGLDVVAYGAHIAAMLGAHIVKVKIPTAHIEFQESYPAYKSGNIKLEPLNERIRHIVNSVFNGRRMVIFSGGETKSNEEILNEVRAIATGGGHGSIIGRNAFQRNHEDSLALLKQITSILSS